jgi:hypothetical protein
MRPEVFPCPVCKDLATHLRPHPLLAGQAARQVLGVLKPPHVAGSGVFYCTRCRRVWLLVWGNPLPEDSFEQWMEEIQRGGRA